MSFKVTLQSSGHNFAVDDGETVLSAALRHNVGLPYGCRNGRCGSCMATLVSGQLDYPDGKPEVLADSGDKLCLTCSGVPNSDLVLDVAEVESAEEIEVKLLPCRVHSIDHLAHDVIRLKLKLPDAQRLQFMAGQYINFILADGRERAFSIANAPHDDEFIELHIRHVDGGEFTDWVFNQMKDKAILRIQGPLGSFTLNESSERPMAFVAGGTGFAPIKGQIEHAIANNDDRPITLYWGVRSRRDLYMPELPEQWARDHDNIDYVPVLSEPDADWQGRSGWVHEAVLADNDRLSLHDIYMAGPPVMVRAGRDAFRAAGVPDEQMYYDSFEYAMDSKDKSSD